MKQLFLVLNFIAALALIAILTTSCNKVVPAAKSNGTASHARVDVTAAPTPCVSCDHLGDVTSLGSEASFDRDTAAWKRFIDTSGLRGSRNSYGFYLSRNELLRLLCDTSSGGKCDVDGLFIFYGLDNGNKNDRSKEGIFTGKKIKPYVATVKPGSVIKNVTGFVQEGCPGNRCVERP